MDANSVVVFLYKGEKNFEVPVTENLTAEDVCKSVAKFLKFRPISLTLFSLCVTKTSGIWLPPCYRFDGSRGYKVEFRLRHKVPSLTDLSRQDPNAFDYTFHQIRHDVLHGDIPEILLEQRKSEALGLCVTDMLRTVLEDGVAQSYVENNYRQYVPKFIYKYPPFFLKKRIHENLTRLVSQAQGYHTNTRFIKEQYISHLEVIAPSYLAEEFHAMTFRRDEYPATVRVDPYHSEHPGVSMTYIGKTSWEHLCTIEDLCFVSMREDCTAEISRKNGIPICFKFKSLEQVHSFVSLLDGYYRLTEKWTFNLCKDLPSPSLEKLRFLKCHGPIGEKFSHQKLSTHPNSVPGSFILRLSSTAFDEYCIDYITTNKQRPMTKTVIQTSDGKCKVEVAKEEFETISELISFFLSKYLPEFPIKECLPPSEYDRSPLLLCRKSNIIDIRNLKTSLRSDEPVSSAPQCISARTLQIFRGKRFEYEGKNCNVYKGIWKPNKSTNVDVAIKFLKNQSDEKKMKEFFEMADKCILWQCDSLINLRGIVLGNPQALVLDWMPLGPLDIYLKENCLHVESVELIEAASHIAKALWFLEDHGIVHGNIRCHNILVSEHSDTAFNVKLADPSITDHSSHELHWIPPEFFEIPSLCKTHVTADVYSVGTTLWEVFSMGEKPPTDLSYTTYKSKYLTGWKLPRPNKCPPEIFRIMFECWLKAPDSRKQPQAMVRDIHQILYHLIGAKRAHAYESITPTSSINGAFDVSSDLNWTTFGSDPNVVGESSGGTISTFLQEVSHHSGGSHQSNSTQCTWLFNPTISPSPDLISGFSGVYTNGSVGTIYSTGSAQGIYVFGKDQITLGRMIGQGCYGAVYLGELVRSDGSSENVAVKMMKDKEAIPEKDQLDFQQEFEILQSLCHQNIVEVKGVVNDPGLLLIMEYLPMGSLLDYFRVSLTKPTLRELMKFAQDVAEGMEYLSANNIVHRDLAARNILVSSENLVKISDFGLARFTGNDNCYTFRTDRKLPIKWYPPESLQYQKFSEQSDVWSYGVTLYEIFSLGREPNLPGLSGQDVEVDEIFNLLTKGVRLTCPEFCPPAVYSILMLSCWQLNPMDRPTFAKIVGDLHEIENRM
ncbi:unnamed protein product [Orchesella dallaii]|uniref:non-specific protein-tyrosine kinase n=1 Tax=Orchesella dallaii TaxID=48710 RepID=A0ABP1QBD5_9HEXA